MWLRTEFETVSTETKGFELNVAKYLYNEAESLFWSKNMIDIDKDSRQLDTTHETHKGWENGHQSHLRSPQLRRTPLNTAMTLSNALYGIKYK